MSKKYTTNFGSTVSQSLTVRGLSQSTLAASMNRSPSYVNRVMTGDRKPGAMWADLIADALNASDEERQKLHKAAALDNGFKLDLTKKGG